MGIRYTNTSARGARDLWVCRPARGGMVCLCDARSSRPVVCGTTIAVDYNGCVFERDDRGANNGRSSGELCVVGVVGVGVVVDAREVDVVGARETERAQVSRETVGFKRPVDGVARGGA